MRKLAILIFQTLDGVVQAPKLPEEDTSNNFQHGGWADKYWEELMASVGKNAMNSHYDVVLGKNTYDMFYIHNAPNSNSPLNKMTKYVVTNSKENLEWENSIKISGNIVEEITKLKNQGGSLLQVHGSWKLIQTLLENNLIDEFRIWTVPEILGEGKRLFENTKFLKKISLIKSETLSNGVVMSIYKRE